MIDARDRQTDTHHNGLAIVVCVYILLMCIYVGAGDPTPPARPGPATRKSRSPPPQNIGAVRKHVKQQEDFQMLLHVPKILLHLPLSIHPPTYPQGNPTTA
jgi:hypothetical protein